MNKKRFHKILVANRGEIALRIIHAIQDAGMKAVCIYAEPDREMPFVHQSDESWSLGEGSLAKTYLNQEAIIQIAQRTAASAIHPGYGFLAENASFAARCREHEITFIGPDPEVIDLMGNKANARETAIKFGVPVIEGATGTRTQIEKQAESMDFPLLLKPAAGGGGKGMHIVRSVNELHDAIEDAVREAMNYFGSDELYVERYIENARHIEVQVLADEHGNVVHLFERECSLQRRHQKIIEEAPSPSVSPEIREKLTRSAVDLTKGIGYTGAGTLEYLMDQDEKFYFIEMNTRIQVEHPVTELVTGIDIVREQLRIATGEELSLSQDQVKITGHAIEARLYAEDPANGFLPSTGKIRRMNSTHVNIRVDEGYIQGNIITPYYDPLIAKLISSGSDRKEAITRLIGGLRNYHLSGVITNRDFLVTLLLSDELTENRIDTRMIDRKISDLLEMTDRHRDASSLPKILCFFAVAAICHKYHQGPPGNTWERIGHWRQLSDIQLSYRDKIYRVPFRMTKPPEKLEICYEEKTIRVSILDHQDNFFKLMIDGTQYLSWADVDGADIIVDIDQFTFHARRLDIPDERYIATSLKKVADEDIKEISAPLNGKIVKISVEETEQVKAGDTLMVIESMKMENRIISPRDAEIKAINVRPGELVEANKLLITLN